MLCIASSWLTYFITGSVHLLTIFTHLAHPDSLPLLSILSFLRIYVLGLFASFCPETPRVMRLYGVWCLSFSVSLTSLGIMSSESRMVFLYHLLIFLTHWCVQTYRYTRHPVTEYSHFLLAISFYRRRTWSGVVARCGFINPDLGWWGGRWQSFALYFDSNPGSCGEEEIQYLHTNLKKKEQAICQGCQRHLRSQRISCK